MGVKKMKYVVLIAMCMIIMGSAFGATYNLTPGNCMIDGTSNNTYCSAWPKLNVNKTLGFGDEWTNTDMNITITPPSSPKINENLNLTFGGVKNYYDYNLSIGCETGTVLNYTLAVNETKDDTLRKVHIECAKDMIAVQNASKDISPGEAWYNIRCLPLLKPINGTITLEANETFNRTWTFETDGGNCTVAINPTQLFWRQIDVTSDYRDCDINLNSCQSQLSTTKGNNDTYLLMLAIVIAAAAFFAIVWFRDVKGGVQWIKPFVEKDKLKEHMKTNETRQIENERHLQNGHLDHYKKRYQR